MKYPQRCQIVDVTGREMPGTSLPIRTPDVSRPHIGKEGTAELLGDSVRVTLDDGTVLRGSECWWEPLHGEGG